MFRLPAQIPIEEYPPPEVFIEEAERLVDEASRRGIVLRVMGGMAIYMRCGSEFAESWKKLKRLGDRVFTDIDFVSYSKHKNDMIEFMRAVGYQTDANLIVQAGKNRQIFYGGKVPMVEVFYDKLDMNHLIDYSGRLEADTVTVPLAELMLQKLQIVKINDKDIKDLAVLLATHDIGKGNPEKIEIDLINSKYMQSDWNFYYTATTNLAKVIEAVKGFDVLTEEDKLRISQRAARALQAIESAPKTVKWKLRARIGPKVKWYNDVDEW
ncbi:MAG: hypothetical protein ACUVT7_00140 [Thermoplasmata archaeon]